VTVQTREKKSFGPVLIVGAAGWTNVGDDLIARQLGRYVRNNGLTPAFLGGPAVASVGTGIAMDSSFRGRLCIVREVSRASAVVIGGGGLLDDRQQNFYRPFARVAAIARLARVPYALVGVGVGPINSAQTARDYRKLVAGAEAVLVRDAASSLRLEEIGCDPARIRVVGDPVLWKESERPPSTTHQWAVNLRQWNQGRSDVGFGFDPADLVGALASSLNDRVGADDRVSLVSMSDLPGDDDRRPLHALRTAAGRPDWTIVSGTQAAEQALEEAQSVISMRLHGCLVAARVGRAVLGIAYEPKVEQQAERCGFVSVRASRVTNPAALKRAMDEMLPTEGLHEAAPEWPFKSR
jgi:polysaccharide pyruvyl transferase WcaK-like protein